MWPCRGSSGLVPGQYMALRGLPQPGELKPDRIRSKSGRRVHKTRSRGWVARGCREKGGWASALELA